jgi:hypothetical protein
MESESNVATIAAKLKEQLASEEELTIMDAKFNEIIDCTATQGIIVFGLERITISICYIYFIRNKFLINITFIHRYI